MCRIGARAVMSPVWAGLLVMELFGHGRMKRPVVMRAGHHDAQRRGLCVLRREVWKGVSGWRKGFVGEEMLLEGSSSSGRDSFARDARRAPPPQPSLHLLRIGPSRATVAASGVQPGGVVRDERHVARLETHYCGAAQVEGAHARDRGQDRDAVDSIGGESLRRCAVVNVGHRRRVGDDGGAPVDTGEVNGVFGGVKEPAARGQDGGAMEVPGDSDGGLLKRRAILIVEPAT